MEKKVFYRSGKLANKKKMEPSWDVGVYLGSDWRTGGAVVGIDGEVIVAHALRRVPLEDRWSVIMLNQVKGFPWQRKQASDSNEDSGQVIQVPPSRASISAHSTRGGSCESHCE